MIKVTANAGTDAIRSLRAHYAKVDDFLRQIDFPLYGLSAEWPGSRMLSHTAWGGSLLLHVSLAHRPAGPRRADQQTPRLLVDNIVEGARRGGDQPSGRSAGQSEDHDGAAWHLMDGLRDALRLPSLDVPTEEHADLVLDPRRVLEEVGELEMGAVVVGIDGVPVVFRTTRLVGTSHLSVAIGRVGDYQPAARRADAPEGFARFVRLVCHHWPLDAVASTGLASIPDLRPYTTGRDRYLTSFNPGPGSDLTHRRYPRRSHRRMAH